ncbi:MAG: class I SAM-dependent methyltransferase [Treponema sp.]|nr:class I SAM-dependent methyltransferase [Treponema sp.]
MKEEIAKKLSNAVAENDHDLLIYKSELSQSKVKWIDEYLYKYIKPGKTFVELGCGSGKQIFKVEELGLKVTGIEISKGMIQRAINNKIAIGSKAEIIEGSYFDIPLNNNSVDYVLFPKNIIECSYNEFEIVCNEVYRILYDDGKFIITMNENFEKYMDLRNSDKFNIINGCNNNEIHVPNKIEAIEYPTYYWTAGFANYIVTKKFVFNDMLDGIDAKKTILLIYGKKK